MTAGDAPVPEPNLPDIDAGACVHGMAVHASCRACVDACPRDAWIMSDDGLGLDTTACDGCGVCVPACPQAAIGLPRPQMAARSVDERDTVLAACEIAVSRPGKGVVACLDAFGIDDLARLHRTGLRRLLMSRGDCANCHRGRTRTFDTAVEHLDRLTADRGLARLRVDEQPAAQWQTLRDQHMRPSRRSLFNAFRQPAADEAAIETARQPAAATLAAGRPVHGISPVLPVIDGTLCVACDACARICPSGAITIEPRGDGEAAYAIDAPRCTACRLCGDVCDAGAVSLSTWTAERPRAVDLDAAQCTACGNVFRVARGKLTSPPLCRICQKARHSRNLFQVLK